MERKYNDLIGDILQNAGEKDNYNGKGKGKPIPDEYFQKDLFQNFQKIAKDAGYLPAWLALQKDISKLVHSCKTEKDVEIINEKIKKHNLICPTPTQKGLVSLSNIETAKKIW